MTGPVFVDRTTTQFDDGFNPGGISSPGHAVHTYVTEALVVDVIHNETHPQYSSDGFNIGLIRVRTLQEKRDYPHEILHDAHPMDYNICDIPLIGEIVLIQQFFGIYYYTRKLAVGKNINHNAIKGLEPYLLQNVSSTETKNSATQEHVFGNHKEKFVENTKIRMLRPNEGDLIIQGRFGNSIRFGSTLFEPNNKNNNPNILMRVGQAPNGATSTQTSYGLIYEDLNQDATSFWMVSDQEVPFKPATMESAAFIRSVKGTPIEFKGSQAFLNSDQLVFNSKKKPIYLFSGKDITMSALQDITMDTDRDIALSSERNYEVKVGRSMYFYAQKNIVLNAVENLVFQGDSRYAIIGNNCFIGTSDNDADPLVLGTELSKFLARLILALTKGTTSQKNPGVFLNGANSMIHVLTPTGPGRLAPAVVTALQQLYKELMMPNEGQRIPKRFAGAPFNSRDNYTVKRNELVRYIL